MSSTNECTSNHKHARCIIRHSKISVTEYVYQQQDPRIIRHQNSTSIILYYIKEMVDSKGATLYIKRTNFIVDTVCAAQTLQ